MFAVVESYKSKQNGEDEASTCLTHVETREAGIQSLREQIQIDFDLATEIYSYRLIEFKGECPNCGRNFEF